MPQDPSGTGTAATTAAASRPVSPLPHPHHHYPSPQQQQPLPVRSPSPALANLFPFASSGRGFVPKGVRGVAADRGYQSPPLAYSPGVRGMHLDYLNHALHVSRPLNHVQFPHLCHVPPTASPPPVKAHPKAATRTSVSDINGHKDTGARERSRDNAYTVVRDRKVRIKENASLYALCRSWLRNGINEGSQPQQKDVTKALPKPLPASMVASYMSIGKEDEKDKDEQEENEKSVENLSPQDLLKRHVKRAKRFRARLREQRLQRISRYRSRLRLLLPPAVEPFRNDTAAGN